MIKRTHEAVWQRAVDVATGKTHCQYVTSCRCRIGDSTGSAWRGSQRSYCSLIDSVGLEFSPPYRHPLHSKTRIAHTRLADMMSTPRSEGSHDVRITCVQAHENHVSEAPMTLVLDTCTGTWRLPRGPSKHQRNIASAVHRLCGMLQASPASP